MSVHEDHSRKGRSRTEPHPVFRNAELPKRKLDRRIERSRDRLGDALIALIQEKPVDSITVQDVLDRAGVGRATFYAHFRDKEDLFLSDADEFLEAMANALSYHHDASDRVAPVRELFAHVSEARQLQAALVASGWIHDFLELAQGHFSRGIDRRLSEHPRSRGLTAERRAPLAYALAGALLSMLSWWMERGCRESPERMDELFHQMVWAGVISPGGADSLR